MTNGILAYHFTQGNEDYIQYVHLDRYNFLDPVPTGAAIKTLSLINFEQSVGSSNNLIQMIMDYLS